MFTPYGILLQAMEQQIFPKPSLVRMIKYVLYLVGEGALSKDAALKRIREILEWAEAYEGGDVRHEDAEGCREEVV